MSEKTLGIIGGSGLYDLPGLEDRETVEVETPFGKPSDALVTGTLHGVRMAFLPRHGRGHRLSPSELPFRANIYAMKKLGMSAVVGISAVGSMKIDLRPAAPRSPPSSATAASRTRTSPTRSGSPCARSRSERRARLAPSRTTAAPTSAWKALCSARAPSRGCTEAGAST
jgi:hypothetical protein